MGTITKSLYNDGRFDKHVELSQACASSAGSPDWVSSGTGWIVVHNTNSGAQSDTQVIMAGAASKTGANYYIGKNGDIYEIANPSTTTISHCGTSYAEYNTSKSKLSNDLLDKNVQSVVKTNPRQDQNFNFFSVGIECVTPGFGALSQEQVVALHYVCKQLQDRFPQLRKGGITCHGMIMPNTGANWGEKYKCGREALGQLKSAYSDLSYAKVGQTPYTKALADDSVKNSKVKIAKADDTLTDEDFEDVFNKSNEFDVTTV